MERTTDILIAGKVGCAIIGGIEVRLYGETLNATTINTTFATITIKIWNGVDIDGIALGTITLTLARHGISGIGVGHYGNIFHLLS